MYIFMGNITFGGYISSYRVVFHHHTTPYVHIRTLMSNGVYKTIAMLFERLQILENRII